MLLEKDTGHASHKCTAGKRSRDAGAGRTLGCGVGVTPVHIVKKYGSHVTGVDIREKMVECARERAVREDLSDWV